MANDDNNVIPFKKREKPKKVLPSNDGKPKLRFTNEFRDQLRAEARERHGYSE